MNETPPAGISDAIALLRTLDLTEIAVSASIAADGSLEGVGGLTDKIDAATARQREYGRLHGLLLATGQADLQELRKSRGEAIPILDAFDFESAILELSVHSAPRRVVAEQSPSTFRVFGVHHPVTFDGHYQQLPLLKRVEQERLPRLGDDVEPSKNDERSRLRYLLLERWDEHVLGDHGQYDEVRLEQALTEARNRGAPRFVLIGPPGSGKSTALAFIAHLCLRADRPLRIRGKEHLPVQISLPAWQEWCAQTPSYSLADYLAYCYREHLHGPSVAQWQQWLRSGNVFLLLDGLDELDMRSGLYKQGLNALLNRSEYARCPLVISCRSISYEQHRGLAAELPVFTLAGLSPRQQAVFIRQYLAPTGDAFDSEGLITELRRLPNLRPLAANPLLLSILCLVATRMKGGEMPARRSELYERAVEQILAWGERRKRRTTTESNDADQATDSAPRQQDRMTVNYPPGMEPALEQQPELLEELALDLWLGDDECQLTFDGRTLHRTLEKVLRRKEYPNPPMLTACLIQDWVQHSGLLRRAGPSQYTFLHLTLQEYFVGKALACRVNSMGWASATLSIGQESMRVVQLLREKLWDLRWREVIALCAGCSEDPNPLLKILASEPFDYSHEMLLLAARCIGEAVSKRASQDHESAITRDLLLLLCSDSVVDQKRAMDVIGGISYPALQGPLTEWLSDRERRHIALSILCRIGGQPATTILRTVLEDEGAELRYRAVAAECLGLIATEDAVDAILSVVPGANPVLRFALTQAMIRIEEDAGICVLSAVLQDQHMAQDARESMLKDIGRCHFDSTPQGLLEAMKDKNEQMRVLAATALGDAGRDVSACNALIDALFDPAPKVREVSLRALRAPWFIRYPVSRLIRAFDVPTSILTHAALLRLKTGGCHSGAIAGLLQLLVDPSPELRTCSAMSLGEIADRAALDGLTSALGDRDADVRREAARSLGKIADPASVNGLLSVLNDKEKSVCRAAASALGKIGDRRALHALIAAIGDEDTRVRIAATEAIGEIGDHTACGPLLSLLNDMDEAVRLTAIDALAKVRGYPALGDLLVRTSTTERGDGSLHAHVALALGAAGVEAATPALLQLLNESEHFGYRQRAVSGLLQIGTSVALAGLAAGIANAKTEQAMTPILEGLARTTLDGRIISRISGSLANSPVKSARLFAVRLLKTSVNISADYGALESALQDQDQDIRKVAANVMMGLARGNGMPASLDALVRNRRLLQLHYPTKTVYRAIVEAWPAVGSTSRAGLPAWRETIFPLSCCVWADGVGLFPRLAQQAERLYRTALSMMPDLAPAVCGMAELLIHWPGRVLEATRLLEIFTSESSLNARGWYLLGSALAVAGDYNRSLDAFERAAAVSETGVKKAEALSGCAEACLGLRNPDLAADYIERAKQADSKCLQQYSLDIRLAIVRGERPHFGKKAIERASRDGLAGPLLSFVRGLALVARGELGEAVKAYADGIADATYWLHVQSALVALTEVRQHGSELPDLSGIRERLEAAQAHLVAEWPPTPHSTEPTLHG